jgi:5-methylcytosine-specific restriction endonuclease McrA
MEIVMTYQKKMLDPRWQKARLAVFERDGWKCRICHDKETSLHAHHTYYDKNSEGPWDYNLESIVTLCEMCHADEHDQIDEAKKALFDALAATDQFSSDILFSLASRVRELANGKR